MSTENYSEVVQTARDYYNSEDADNFYFHIWGGEDIHIGLYESESEPIADASRRTVARMASLIKGLGPDSRVLDLGAGYGGSMRYLAQKFGCRCVALNLSEVENERNRTMNREQGLEELIDVVDGDFTGLPYDDASFDVIWSQDAFLHSGDRRKVCAEAVRVLKPGGQFIFTDPMQSDEADTARLQPVYDRIHLDSLGSPGFYREVLGDMGMEEVDFEAHPEQLTRHYSRVRHELQSNAEELVSRGVSTEYVDRMKSGLGHWVERGKAGDLTWGILIFRKKA